MEVKLNKSATIFLKDEDELEVFYEILGLAKRRASVQRQEREESVVGYYDEEGLLSKVQSMIPLLQQKLAKAM